MKTKFALASFFAALSGLTGLATTAKAETHLRVNLNFGLPVPIIVVPAREHAATAYGYSDRGFVSYDSRDTCTPASRGYWKEITVKTWVPERWVVSRDRRGCEFRTLERGYFTYRTDRVWVADNDDRGHFGNERGYYGRG